MYKIVNKNGVPYLTPGRTTSVQLNLILEAGIKNQCILILDSWL
jgi:hypothetical protein